MDYNRSYPTNYSRIDIIGRELIDVHLSLEGISEETLLLEQYAGAAIDFVEITQNYPCVYSEFKKTLSLWPKCFEFCIENIDFKRGIKIKYYPLVGSDLVDLSTSLYEVQGNEIVFVVDNMPELAARKDAVLISFWAGYQCWPERLKQIALIHIGDFYKDREDKGLRFVQLTDKLHRKIRRWNA